MKRALFMGFTAFVAGAIVLSPWALTSERVGTPPKATLSPKWSIKMQELYQTLGSLLTDVTSDRRFSDLKNKSRIETQAKKLSRLAHDLTKKSMVSPDSDPTIQIIGGMLARQTQRAATELKRGNRAYARGILRSVPSYCIACHTRNSSGPQFAQLPLEPSADSLLPIERGEFFAATRQFDRAQQEFKKVILNSRTAGTEFFDWERAVTQSLAIAVRVKRDPTEALDIVDAVIKTDKAPTFIRQDAQTWKTSLQEWKKEGTRLAETSEGLHMEAIRLLVRGHEIQKYPMDRTADIFYLRASSVIHDLLQTKSDANQSAEAFHLAGVAYEVLSPRSLEDLHEIYYEACIRRAPHTPTAELCLKRYEGSIYNGYTGSGGTHIPKEIYIHINELRLLAQPEQKVQP